VFLRPELASNSLQIPPHDGYPCFVKYVLSKGRYYFKDITMEFSLALPI